MSGPIYEPKGAALEYCEWALNIYSQCPHSCAYCYCPKVLHKDPRDFFGGANPRNNIVEKVRKQIEKEGFTGRTIHLCFVGDPYPTGYDSEPTREIIKLLKESGNHVQILTKGDGRRDFDLLDGEDWYGVTLDGGARRVTPAECYGLKQLIEAKEKGIKTWVSFEPVLSDTWVLNCIKLGHEWFDKVKIGKLNYFPSEINWKEFGIKAEALCREVGLDYYIKDGLRKEMEK